MSLEAITVLNSEVPADRAASQKRLRVVHVVAHLDVGGMEKLLVEFARHADRNRFDLRFISLGTRGALADEIESCGWPVTALEQGEGRRPAMIFHLARFFRRWRADVVHTHNTKSLIYGAAAARLARVRRVVHTRHGQCYGASARERRAFRLATRLVDRVVCVSDDSARLSAIDGVATKRICTVHNGIDTHRFDYRGPCPGGPVVVVGRLSAEKSVETLIEAVAICRRDDPTVRLEIAGNGPCLGQWQAVTEKLGLSDSVRFLGEVADVAGFLSRASLFVLPSLTEGVSLTLLEAMARGLPVIATAVGGNPEVVVHGETGLLVPPRSPAELASAMRDLISDPSRCQEMGLAGRRRVEAHFDVRAMVATYEAIYDEHQAPNRESDSRQPAGDGVGAAR